MTETARSTRPMRVLVVEDEYYIAQDIASALREAGLEVVGPAATLADAEQLLETQVVQAAVLDMNLRGELAFALADRLTREGVPVIIASGYDDAALAEGPAGHAKLTKPFALSQLVADVRRVLQPAT